MGSRPALLIMQVCAWSVLATRDGHRLISVVLNAPRWYADTTAILDYGYAKLAADPAGVGAEQLSVSKRGAVSWLLGKAGDRRRHLCHSCLPDCRAADRHLPRKVGASTL